MSLRGASTLLGAVAALGLFPPGASAQAPVHYTLQDTSTFSQGCFPPCLCPLFLGDEPSGTFQLTFEGSGLDSVDHYRVENVDWSYVLGQEVRVTGSGQYDIGGELVLEQRLQLDLSFDGEPPVHFDSGFLPGGSLDPFEITISRNNMVCWDQVFGLNAVPTPALGSSYCVSNPNSSGEEARISALGSAVVADDDFTLFATRAPADRFGIFFYGPNQVQQPLGAGFRCVGGTVQRLQPLVQVAANGTASRRIDLTAQPASSDLTAGMTMNFQLWFRDNMGSTNLTDGVEVMFQ